MTPLATAVSDNLNAARDQMGVSLGWHIIVASLGVGFPIVMIIAEWRGVFRGDAAAMRLARTWSKVAGVLFAVGAVSGTIISFEMGILWPGLLGTFGSVIGLPFALEGFAFFIEAIFVGIYLYGWNRLSARAHFLSGIPIAVAANALRIFGTGLCVEYWDPAKAEGFFHEFSGWIIFILSVGLLLGVHQLLGLVGRTHNEALP